MSYRSSNVKETCLKTELFVDIKKKSLYLCLYKEWSSENHSKIYTFMTAVIDDLREIIACIVVEIFKPDVTVFI